MSDTYTSLDPIIEEGTLLTLSYGTYEDYTVTRVFKVNKTFNIEEVAKTYYFQTAEKEYAKNPDDFWLWGYKVSSNFPNWLFENGYLSNVDEKRIYLGDEYFFDHSDWEEEFKKQKGIK